MNLIERERERMKVNGRERMEKVEWRGSDIRGVLAQGHLHVSVL